MLTCRNVNGMETVRVRHVVWVTLHCCLYYTDEKDSLLDEECKRFRSQYSDPSAAYSAMWSKQWAAGSVPHIKEEKTLPAGGAEVGGGHSQSPSAAADSAYPSSAFPFSSANTNTSPANNDVIYETMSQVYPALSSTLGKATLTIQHSPYHLNVNPIYHLAIAVSSSGGSNLGNSDFYPSNPYTQYTGSYGYPYSGSAAGIASK